MSFANPKAFEGVHITVNENEESKEITLEWYRNNKLNNLNEEVSMEKLNIQDTTFLGEKAVVTKSGSVIVAKGDYTYEIGYLHPGPADEYNYKNFYDMILSTFEFIEDMCIDSYSF